MTNFMPAKQASKSEKNMLVLYNSTLRAQAQNEGHCGTSIVASLGITRIVCIGTYSILCDFGAYTSFYAYTRI